MGPIFVFPELKSLGRDKFLSRPVYIANLTKDSDNESIAIDRVIRYGF